MRLPPLLLAAAALLLCCDPAFAQGVIEGRVALPKQRNVQVMTKRYEVVTKGGVLATSPPLAVVYLEGVGSTPGPRPTKQVTQKEMTFLPLLLPVQVGTRVEFPNEDDAYHNIFSYSPRSVSISAAIARRTADSITGLR
jgi:plastocyanin